MAVAGVNDAPSTSAYPTNYTNGLRTASGSGSGHVQVSSARRVLTAASENPGSFTVGSEVEWVAYTIAVRPAPVNTAPTITSNGGGATAAVSVPENSTAVTDVDATDPDVGDILTYSISGGADQALFSINPTTGVLTFSTAPDFEAPADVGMNNVYEVTVRVSDGSLTDTQDITVTVTNVNEAPTDIALDNTNVDENAGVNAEVGTLSGTDPDAGQSAGLTFSLPAGVNDNDLFNISGGNLRANDSFDYETDSSYTVTVRATDTGTPGLTYDEPFTITVNDVNEPPTITSNGGGPTAAVSVAENTTAVTTVTATDPDVGDILTYSISGGADALEFSITPTTGVLTFDAPPDFEAPTDADGDNVYEVTVEVSDGSLTDTQDISVTVTSVNEAPPEITSDGGGDTAAVSVAENTTAVTTVTATDPDVGDTLTYSISGGADALEFSIAPTTGVLTFDAPPDFEAPTDADGDNVYEVTVEVSDGALTDTQDISVTVTSVNEAPIITSDDGGPTADVSVAENTTFVTDVDATDPDVGDILTYSISGGADAALFSIDPGTGMLTFNTAPDFEAPADVGANNVYEVTVEVSDGALTDTQALSVTIIDVAATPTITSDGGGDTAAISVPENTTAVTTVTASTEPDLGVPLTYSISGGADAALFSINPTTGVLTFISAPDFEAPTDTDGDNVYEVTVEVSDGALSDTQDISVTVTNVNEAPPEITSDGGGDTAAVSVPENTTAVTDVNATDPDPGDTLTYSISGGADALEFSIAPGTGVLTFVTPPNFEAPADVGANNVYEVTVQVSDLADFTDTQDISVTVTNVNEAPTITSNGGGPTAAINVPENTTAVTTVIATDPDAGTVLTYSISGGADAAKFSMGFTGALSFISAPDFEAPTDVGANNVYEVTVQVSDGALTDTQALSVTVTDVGTTTTITSNGGGPTAAINVPENTTAVTTVTAATEPDTGGTFTYSISGGADAAKFSINPITGVLTFLAAPNFEAPTDVGANNVYNVTVQASNGTSTDTQALAVTVVNVNEPPTITSNGGGPTAGVSVPENTTFVTDVDATDPDAGTTFFFSISGGADAAKFSIGLTGVLTFISAPDFEAPTDAGANNVYNVTVQVSDGALTDTQALSVTVTDVSDGVGADRWSDISNAQWLAVYGATADQVATVAGGYPDGTFRPSLPINRAQFSKMVVDGFGLPVLFPAVATYSDVPLTHFYSRWIEGAAAALIITGFPNGTFGPSLNITRQQANSILGRYLSQQELADNGSIEGALDDYPSLAAWYAAEGEAVLAQFADRAQLAAVHRPFTAYLVYKGIVLGSPSGGNLYLMPLSNLTRAQAAVLIVRAMQ